MSSQPSPSLSVFAGIDGGGTKCRVRLSDAQGRLLGEAEGGPANIRLGLELVWSNMTEALREALNRAGRADVTFDQIAIGLGLAGIADASDVFNTIMAGPRFGFVNVATDAHAACLGAFSGRDGGILIAGTGSAGYGWVNQTAHTVGGWGFEVCDDGSGASLGREAIRSALQSYDGLAPTTDFTRDIIRHFGTPADIVHWVTTAKPKDFGELAPITMRFAEGGDAVAVELVQQATHDLGRYIMRLHEIGCDKVCLVGGMATPFLPWLSPWTKSVLAQPEHDAVEGAILLARGAPNGFDRALCGQSEEVMP